MIIVARSSPKLALGAAMGLMASGSSCICCTMVDMSALISSSFSPSSSPEAALAGLLNLHVAEHLIYPWHEGTLEPECGCLPSHQGRSVQ